MTAYFIAFRDKMHDPERYAAYLQKATRSLDGRTAEVLVGNGKMAAVEGVAPDGVVVIAFPSFQAAKEWYESPAYQAVVGERLAATEGRSVIVEGF